jgi:hypothetical protein
MNKLKELYFKIQAREGFSVKHDLSTYEGGGFAVGGASTCHEIKVDDLSFNRFTDIMADLCALTRGKASRLLIGGWVDDDGVAYLELSDIVQKRAVAVALGKDREEIAIYDLWNNEEIKLK